MSRERVCLSLIRDALHMMEGRGWREGMLVYCVCAEGNCIDVICPEKRRRITRIPFEQNGMGLRRICGDERGIYVSCSYQNKLYAQDLKTGERRFAATGAYPTDLCMDEGYLYVCCSESNSIWQMHRGSLLPEQILASGEFPIGLRMEQGEYGFVTVIGMQVIVGRGKDSWAYTLKAAPYCAALLGEDIAIAGYGTLEEGDSRIIKIQKGHCLKETRYSGGMAGGCCLFANKKKIAMTDLERGNVYVFDADTLEMIHQVPCARMVDDIRSDEKNGRLYASAMADDEMVVLYFHGNILDRIPTEREPRGLCLIGTERYQDF